MNRKLIGFWLIFILLWVYSTSFTQASGDEDAQPVQTRSWCDDHPDWNICQHRDRLDPSDIMEHDRLVYPEPVNTSSTPKTRLEICEDIVKTYNKTHLYEIHNYDCDDMTLDIWNQLKKEYINAKIGLGNVTSEVDNLWESSHAWVIAEYEPDKWIALEGIDGKVVNKKDNPLYYTGWFFETPLEYKKYRELAAQYNDVIIDLNQLQLEYNMSPAGSDDLKNVEVIISDHEKKRKKLETQMIALSQGVKTSNLNLVKVEVIR